MFENHVVQSDVSFWGQAGKPHPQDPENPRKRIYRVFDKIDESASDQAATGFGLHGRSQVADNKAQRQAFADALTTKAASTMGSSSLGGLFGGAEPSKRKDPKGRNKKVPKELTPEEKSKKDFDADMKQSLGSILGTVLTESYYRIALHVCLRTYCIAPLFFPVMDTTRMPHVTSSFCLVDF